MNASKNKEGKTQSPMVRVLVELYGSYDKIPQSQIDKINKIEKNMTYSEKKLKKQYKLIKELQRKEDILPSFNKDFTCNNFNDLNGVGRVKPKVIYELYTKKNPLTLNQIEYHNYFQGDKLLNFDEVKKILNAKEKVFSNFETHIGNIRVNMEPEFYEEILIKRILVINDIYCFIKPKGVPYVPFKGWFPVCEIKTKDFWGRERIEIKKLYFDNGIKIT